MASCFPLLTEILKAKGEEERLAAIDRLVATLVLLEEYFINCSSEGNGNFFGGDSIGYVDIALGCFLGWFKALEKMFDVKVLDITKMPRLAKWAERFCSDDAVKNVIPEIEKLSEFAKINLMK
ncbi:Glutathione S-transferase U18 [Camellia lanceoleosa]|uniref:Glutathione S-transferase U18 n=1 Tax=Camellia lanceoleosa TaxID=1840588 RepID=A0ACC0IFC6_9ERIC|nr:Glutathione S-transferase U18 [Camellia lanceoleosa]